MSNKLLTPDEVVKQILALCKKHGVKPQDLHKIFPGLMYGPLF